MSQKRATGVFTITTIVDGTDGTSPLVADLSNQMDSVPMTSGGSVTAQTVLTTTFRLLYGEDQQTLTALTSSGAATGVTVSCNATTGVVTVTVAKDTTLANDKNVITITGTCAKGSRTAEFTIAGVRGGADGSPAVMFKIMPSTDVIKKSKTGTLTPASPMTCSVQKVSGSNVSTAAAADGKLRYRLDGDINASSDGTEMTIGGSVAYANTNSYITFAFFVGTTLRDKERIPIVADGADGTSPLVADLSNGMDSVPMTSDGKVTANTTLTTTLKMFYGTTLQTLTALTSSGAATGVTVSCNAATGVVTVTVAKDTTLANDKNVITITGTCSRGSLSEQFTIAGVRGGADGSPAVMFNILPSIDVIKKSKTGTLTPASPMTCSVQKVSGSSVSTAAAADGKLRYRLDGDINASTDGTEMTIGGSVAYANTNSYITFAFFVGTTLRDKERIPIVADGADSTVPGPAGKDGYTVTCEPASLVINQNSSGTYDISSTNPAYFKPKVTKGNSTTNLVTAVTVSANYCIKSSTTNIVTVGSWVDGSGLPITGVAAAAITNKYTQGYLVLSVTADSKTFTITIPIAVNYLGSYIIEVFDGKKTEMVNETKTAIEEDGTFVVNDAAYQQEKTAWGEAASWVSGVDTPAATVKNYNSRISNAETNISKVERIQGENISLADIDAWEQGTISSSNGAKTDSTTRLRTINFIPITDDAILLFKRKATYYFDVFYYNASKTYLGTSGWIKLDATTTAELKKGKYSLSYTNARYVRLLIKLDDSTAVTVANDLHNVSLQVVNSPVGTSSEIEQTATSISATVQNDIEGKLETTGINIKGSNREIELIADKVKFTNSDKTVDDKISIDPTTGTLHAVDGEFEGKIIATEGTIGNLNIEGTMNINGDANGFEVTGSSGAKTSITGDSIGTYYSFSGKSSTIVSKTGKGTINKSNLAITSNISVSLGFVGYNKTCTIENTNVQVKKQASGDSPISLNNVRLKFVVYQNGATLKTVDTYTSPFTFTTTSPGTVTLSIQVWADLSHDYDPTSGTFLVEDYLRFTTPNDGFMQIGYDGLAVNFGQGKTCYLGSEGAYFRFGSYALRITESGIQKSSNASSSIPTWTNI